MPQAELEALLLIATGVFGFIDARVSWVLIGFVGLLHLWPFLR